MIAPMLHGRPIHHFQLNSYQFFLVFRNKSLITSDDFSLQLYLLPIDQQRRSLGGGCRLRHTVQRVKVVKQCESVCHGCICNMLQSFSLYCPLLVVMLLEVAAVAVTM